MRRRGAISSSATVKWDRDAVHELEQIAQPYLVECAEKIGESIVAQVPVHRGVMRESFDPSVDEDGDGAKLYPNSPFWHWLEYGTATSPVYRPVQRGVEATGARYVPS